MSSISYHDISKVNEEIGIGTTIYKFDDTKRQFVYLPQVDYHLLSSEVHLFSPQVFPTILMNLILNIYAKASKFA